MNERKKERWWGVKYRGSLYDWVRGGRAKWSFGGIFEENKPRNWTSKFDYPKHGFSTQWPQM
jgi:hypothetical protein